MKALPPEVKQNFPLCLQRDFELLLNQGAFEIGIDDDFPSELKKRLTAASLSYQMGNRSVDYLKKHYLSDIEYEDEHPDRFDRPLMNFIKREAKKLSELLVEATHRDNSPMGEIVAEWTVMRFHYSMSLALTCANRGALYECVALCRMIVEQLAWAVRIYKMQDADQIRSAQAQSSISSLKELYGSAGKVYGWMSDHAHWAYDAHIKSFDFDGVRLGHMYASAAYKMKSLMLSLVVLDMAQAVHEYIFKEIGFYPAASGAKISDVGGGSGKSVSAWAGDLMAFSSDDDDLITLNSFIRA
ncbi:hypothetical protein [Bosea thiooxidans]